MFSCALQTHCLHWPYEKHWEICWKTWVARLGPFLRDHVCKYYPKNITDLKRVMKYDLLHSLSSGGGFGLVLFFCWLACSFFYFLSPAVSKVSRKPGNSFKCTCINSKQSSLGNQQSSSSFRWLHGFHLTQVKFKKQKKMLIYEPPSSSNQWLTQRRLPGARQSHWVPYNDCIFLKMVR